MKTSTTNKEGYVKLWEWFGFSRSSWLTLPRILMHEMPDGWQNKMADLLKEFDETWDSSEMPNPYVMARERNKFTKWPRWLLNYRHPDKSEIEKIKGNTK